MLGSNGEAAPHGRRRVRSRGGRGASARAGRPAADCRHRPRIDAGGRARRQTGRRSRRRRRARADAVVLQVADDRRRLLPSLHGRGRRLARAGAALQFHRGHRRQPAARRPSLGSPNIRTSSG